MADIYDEALADRKKLLEVAVANAKSKLVDEITPSIKEMVESALLGRLNENEPGDDEDILLGVVDDGTDATMVPGLDALPALPGAVTDIAPPAPMSPAVAGGEPAGLSLPDAQGKVTLDIDALTTSPSGQFELTPESLQSLEALIGIRKPVDLDAIQRRSAKMEAVAKKIVGNGSPSIKDREQARQIKQECKKLYADVQQTRDFLDEAAAKDIEDRLERVFHTVMESYSAAGHLTHVVREMLAINKKAGKLNKLTESRNLTGEDFNACVQLMRGVMNLHASVGRLHESLGADDDSVDGATVRQVGANLATLYMEIRKMVTKKGKQINEADDFDVGGDDVAGIEGDAADVGAEKMLVQLELPASLKDIVAGDQVSVVDVSPAGEDDEMELGGDDDLGGLDADIGDESGEDVEDDLAGLDDAGEDDEMELESADDMYEAKLSDDDIIEIDEAALVAEMKNMKRLREKKDAIGHSGHGPGDLSDFGGGKDDGEKFVDGQDLNQSDPLGSEGYLEEGDDEDLEEADDLDEADELDEEDYGVSGDKWSKKQDKKEMGESRQKSAGKNGQKKEKQLAEAFEKARAELAEQKLFNTKLVALNRVLQLPGLKKAQKEKVVEVLDKGRTIAEVQQLYSKIVETLKKGTSSVNENADKSARGSASRVTTSSSPSTDSDSNPLLEKWNKIAFGGSDIIQG